MWRSVARLHVCRERFPWTQNLEALKQRKHACDTVSLYYLSSFLVLRNQNWLHPHCSGFSDNLKIAQFFPQSNLRKKVQVVSCDGGQAIETLSFVFTYKTCFSIAILLMTSLWFLLSRGGSRIPCRKGRQLSGTPTYDFAKFSKNTA